VNLRHLLHIHWPHVMSWADQGRIREHCRCGATRVATLDSGTFQRTRWRPTLLELWHQSGRA
jgi:hypothetical protein